VLSHQYIERRSDEPGDRTCQSSYMAWTQEYDKLLHVRVSHTTERKGSNKHLIRMMFKFIWISNKADQQMQFTLVYFLNTTQSITYDMTSVLHIMYNNYTCILEHQWHEWPLMIQTGSPGAGDLEPLEAHCIILSFFRLIHSYFMFCLTCFVFV
jgi:hypothetical protein